MISFYHIAHGISEMSARCPFTRDLMVLTGCLLIHPTVRKLGCNAGPGRVGVSGGSMSEGSRQLEHVEDAASEEVRWVACMQKLYM